MSDDKDNEKIVDWKYLKQTVIKQDIKEIKTLRDLENDKKFCKYCGKNCYKVWRTI
jgi:hypothetical protein